MKNILHYGLQRSGTNFLEELLEKNYRVSLLNSSDDRKHPLIKHFRLYDDKRYIAEPAYYNNKTFANIGEYIEALQIDAAPDAIIIISKDPYSWLLSYKAWAKRCNWDKAAFSYIQEYNLFYDKWREFAAQSDKVVFVRYADLLCNTEDELLRLEEQFGLQLRTMRKVRGRKLHLQKVSQSSSFTEDRRAYYQNSGYLSALSEKEINEVHRTVNPELLQFLGYELERTSPAE